MSDMPAPRADRGPTPEEEAAADRAAADQPAGVAEHEEEMNRLGAAVKGEGEIEGVHRD